MPISSDKSGPQRVELPIGGVASGSTFRDQPTRFLPPETTRGIRPFDSAKDRPRLGTTPGIVKLLAQQFGAGAPIQAINTVSRASVIQGYHLGSHARIFGRNSLAGPVAGQLWDYQPGGVTPVLEWENLIDVTGDGGPSPISVPCVGAHPDTDLMVAATASYDDGSSPHHVARVYGFDRYGAQVWSTKLSDANINVFVNTLCVSRLYTFATGVKQVGGVTYGAVWALRNDTGALVETSTCNNWSSECIEARVWRDPATGNDYLFVLFNGSTNSTGSGNLPNGTALTAGFYAKCFRSGVMKFLIPSAAYGGTVFTQAQWGRQLASNDAFFEGTVGPPPQSHGYFRFADNSSLKPRGCIANAMCIDPFGNVYVARCNAGGGPNNSYTPDLTLVRPISVCKISAAGAMVWEQDTDSIIRVGSQAVLNDIPTAGGVEPSVQAIAADGSQVYVAGAPNAATACVFALSAVDGSLRWYNTLEPTIGPPNQTIRQAAVGIDPTDGNVVLGGDRSTTYNGGGAPNASFWKLSSVDGSVTWAKDLGAVSVLGVAFFGSGRLAVSSDQV